MYIYGLGHYAPANIIDNHFFDTLDIASSATWIEERVGIVARRSVLSPDQIRDIRYGRTTRQQLKKDGAIESLTSMCQQSWAHMVGRHQVDLAAIDTVIAGTSVPDDDVPAASCIVAAQLGLESIQSFDVNSACSTFVVQCHVVRGLMKAGMAKTAAVFCAERFTTRINYSDRRNCILFGDGATCAIASATPVPGSLKVIDSLVESAPSGWEHIHMAAGEEFHQNGAAVQKFAINKTIAAAQDILARNNLSPAKAHWFIGHQANYRMLMSATDKMGVPASKHLFNVVDRGNQGACGAPSVLSENWNRYQPGDYIVLAVVGAGLTWGSLLLQKQ